MTATGTKISKSHSAQVHNVDETNKAMRRRRYGCIVGVALRAASAPLAAGARGRDRRAIPVDATKRSKH